MIKHFRPVVLSSLVVVLTALGVRLPGIADGLVSAVYAQMNVSVESNRQLFATMCALHAAGYEAGVGAAGVLPVRARLRRQLLGLQGPAAEAVRAFYREHALADPAETLSRYVSFALVAGPPPKFDYVLTREQLPPDVLALEGFNEVLANFYREAQIEKLWAAVEPEYESEIQRLRGPVAQAVMVSAGYLREVLNPASRLSFSVYAEPMVGAKTNFRTYGDHYAIVLSPGPDLPLDEIRHAFLHVLLDQLALRYPAVVESKKPLLNFAARAPRLPVAYREDFSALLTECLVRAVELRLRKLPMAQRDAAIEDAERDGYVLVRPFCRQLEKFEQAEAAMHYLFPELVKGIDLAEETQRLQKVEFAAVPAVTAQAAAPSSTEGSELDRWLGEGERQIAARNSDAAAATFERVLENYPDQPRALYGLAVASVLRGEAVRAKELFHRLVGVPPRRAEAAGLGAVQKDPMILSWAHVYLGRIHDVEGNRELALSEYRAALAIDGAPESARVAARRGIERGYQPSTKTPDTGQQRP